MNNTDPNTVIKSKAASFFSLFCSGRFAVPWHQRRYDWTAQHVDELLHDIDDAVGADARCYFLGTIILVNSASRQWRINDGQQRIVTLSLICARLRDLFAEHGDSLREHRALRVLFDIEENSTARSENIAHLTPRVTPPREDKTRFNQLIRGRAIGANGKLMQAWRQIDTFVLGMGIDKSRKFFDFLIQKLEVSRLDIPDFVDPNSVYETINNRGKELDDLDLVRNYLYSYFNSDSEAPRRDAVHRNLENIYAQLRDNSRFTDYARCYFQCMFGFLKKSSFYRDVRRHIQSAATGARSVGRSQSDYIYDLVESFSDQRTVEIFRVVAIPNRTSYFVDEFARTSGHGPAARNISTFLHELQTYKVTQPLVFALLRRYDNEDDDHPRKRLAQVIHGHLKNVTSFVLRTAFVAPKFEPSRFESEFSNLAEQVMTTNNIATVDVDGSLNEFDSVYGIIDDRKFRAKMQEIEMRDAKKIKRFLFGVNRRIQPDGDLVNEGRCSIEHIFPKGQKHWKTWSAFDASSKPDEWVHRIGNLTLLGRNDNKPGDKDNRSFGAKRHTYARSAVRVTREIADGTDWSPGEIAKRQKRLVDQAVKVWSFVRSTT